MQCASKSVLCDIMDTQPTITENEKELPGSSMTTVIRESSDLFNCSINHATTALSLHQNASLHTLLRRGSRTSSDISEIVSLVNSRSVQSVRTQGVSTNQKG